MQRMSCPAPAEAPSWIAVVAVAGQCRKARASGPNRPRACNSNYIIQQRTSQGLRPYVVDVMDALRCHQDFQFTDDDGALRAYVAKYVSKFSDSNQD